MWTLLRWIGTGWGCQVGFVVQRRQHQIDEGRSTSWAAVDVGQCAGVGWLQVGGRGITQEGIGQAKQAHFMVSATSRRSPAMTGDLFSTGGT